MSKTLKRYSREIGVLVALLVLVGIFGSIRSIYLNPANLLDIFDQAVINGMLAVGISFVIISGGIDLSVGSTMAVTIVATGKLVVAGIHPIIAVIFALAVGSILGFINGILVAKVKLQPFIATMGTMSVYRGAAYLITGGWPVLNIPNFFRKMIDGDLIGSISTSIFIFLFFIIIGQIVLKKTKLGTYVYAIGNNEEATRLSGVKVDKHKIVAYMICGAMAAVAGLVMLARLGTGEPTAGQGYELNAIAAAAIGGISLVGGKGTMVGTFLGALLLQALKVGLVVLGVDTFWQYIATGMIIVIAACFEVFQTKLKGRFFRRRKA